MTDSMVERVARAIAPDAFDPNSDLGEDYLSAIKAMAMSDARTAIAAMREPPPKCLAALCVWAELSGNKLALEKDALLIWQDVFDVALEDDHADN